MKNCVPYNQNRKYMPRSIQELMETHTGLPGASYLVSLTVKWGDTIKLLYRCLQHHIPQEGHKALSIVIPGRKCPKVRGLESSGANKVRQISELQNFSEPLKLPLWVGTVQMGIKYVAFPKTPFFTKYPPDCHSMGHTWANNSCRQKA